MRTNSKPYLIAFSFAFLVILNSNLLAQTDSLQESITFGTSIAVTNKGISTFPNFTLGKPATIIDLSIGNKFSFDPQFRFSLEGEPWSFILWGHYKLIDNNHFSFKLGAHPAFLFKSENLISESDTNKVMVLQRYLAGQIIPEYSFSKNIKVGMHYIYSHGIENNTISNSHYITLNSTISLFELAKGIGLIIKPEFYYLKMDERDGTYFTGYLAIVKKGFPISLSALINKKIESDIPGENLLWNISLIYRFNKEYISK